MLPHLIDRLKEEEFVFIQTHNFPDHDAVCSAFGLQRLFSHFGIPSHLIYEGEIQRDSLHKTIQEFNIDIRHASNFKLHDEYKIVIVDGCKGNKNVTDLIGEEIAVIDHHESTSPEDVTFSDIRPHIGACCSIIYSYYQRMGVEVPKDVASAMLIGINMDTNLLTRGVDEVDLEAYLALHHVADNQLVNAILRNYIQTRDLEFFKLALDRVHVADRLAFCHFPSGCNQNLLGILGDFFLALEEVDFVVLCAQNEGVINFSLRSEVSEWNAAEIIRAALNGVGFGGGHADMAGGIIKNLAHFDEQTYFYKFMQLVGNDTHKHIWGRKFEG